MLLEEGRPERCQSAIPPSSPLTREKREGYETVRTGPLAMPEPGESVAPFSYR
jgi:hypothetical protein